MAEKKKLTTKQKQTGHRALQYTAVGGMFVSVLTPFIILGIVNREEWFINNADGWKVGLGAAIGAAVVGIAIAAVTFKKEKESKLTNGWITFLVVWFAIAFIAYLIKSIYEEIFNIMMWTGIGLAGAFGLDIFSKNQKRKADEYKIARSKIKSETLEEKIRKEVEEEEEQRVKIKVTK